MLVFLLVIGGIYRGWFISPRVLWSGQPEPGDALLRGGLGRKALAECLLATATTTGMIFIVFGAAVFNGFLAFSQPPQQVADWVTARTTGR
ncbi:MAG: hypothetical protein R3D03_14470 [Geminicoccaceae bacterium]